MNSKDTNKYPSDLSMRKDFLGWKSEEENQWKEKCLNLTRQKWKLIFKNHSKQIWYMINILMYIKPTAQKNMTKDMNRYFRKEVRIVIKPEKMFTFIITKVMHIKKAMQLHFSSSVCWQRLKKQRWYLVLARCGKHAASITVGRNRTQIKMINPCLSSTRQCK